MQMKTTFVKPPLSLCSPQLQRKASPEASCVHLPPGKATELGGKLLRSPLCHPDPGAAEDGDNLFSGWLWHLLDPFGVSSFYSPLKCRVTLFKPVWHKVTHTPQTGSGDDLLIRSSIYEHWDVTRTFLNQMWCLFRFHSFCHGDFFRRLSLPKDSVRCVSWMRENSAPSDSWKLPQLSSLIICIFFVGDCWHMKPYFHMNL